MAPYLPDLGDLAGLLGLIAALALFLGLGSLPGRATPPEARIVAGWGLACVVLTLWGITTPTSLRVPLAGLAVLALWPLARRLAGGSGATGPGANGLGAAPLDAAGTGTGWRGLGHRPLVLAALLSVPYWLVMLPAWPSQVDTWLNLLPNAAYLVDHGMLPRHDRPPAWSFLPVAPYNTQFAAFIASVAAGHLVANGMALFNLALLLLAGLLIARILAPSTDCPLGRLPAWAVAAGIALAIAHWRRAARSDSATRLALIAGIAVLYNGFLLLTYVAHFPPEMAVNAHSYFRYSGHLSLLVMAGLALGLRPVAELVVDWLGQRARTARAGLITLGLIFPLGAMPLLRFDLQAPQPAVFALGPRIAAHLPGDARVAVLAPGDPFDAAGSLVRGVLLYLPPRRPGLDLPTRNRADLGTLEELRAQGAAFAVITCVPQGLPFGAAGQAALLRATPDGWTLVEAWPWPPIPRGERLGALLERPVFCAG